MVSTCPDNVLSSVFVVVSTCPDNVLSSVFMVVSTCPDSVLSSVFMVVSTCPDNVLRFQFSWWSQFNSKPFFFFFWRRRFTKLIDYHGKSQEVTRLLTSLSTDSEHDVCVLADSHYMKINNQRSRVTGRGAVTVCRINRVVRPGNGNYLVHFPEADIQTGRWSG